MKVNYFTFPTVLGFLAVSVHIYSPVTEWMQLSEPAGGFTLLDCDRLQTCTVAWLTIRSDCARRGKRREHHLGLTLVAVHLVTVEASKRLSPTGQTHWPYASSLLDIGHGPAQAAIHERL